MEDSLGWVAAVAIGALQGITEFLPVSSSGHVAIGAWLFGIEDLPLTTVVIVHGGTLLATLLVVGDDLKHWFRLSLSTLRSRQQFLASPHGWSLVGTVLATLPTGLIGLWMEERVETWSHSRTIVGIALGATALVLLTTLRKTGSADRLGVIGYLLIGCAQGVAVIPGISRSGTTIAAGLLLGLRPDAAFRFSFLCSIPAIGGALVLKLTQPNSLEAIGGPALVAGAVAFVFGWAALWLLHRLVRRGKFWLFSLYLVPMGLALVVWDAVR